MTVKNSTNNTKNGRYALGGVTETSVFAIEHWDRRLMKRDPSDILYVIEETYSGRPDLLGQLFYGDPLLWWVVAQYNGIIDPLEELVVGKLLYVPIIERVRSDLFKATPGGIPSTR